MPAKKPIPYPSGFGSRVGFTLIELLITTAIIAILMAVLVVVLDPAEMFKEVRDSNAKSVLTRVAEAVEACYARQQSLATPGNYSNCDTIAELSSGGYLKTGFALPAGGGTWVLGGNATCFCISYVLEATTAENTYWIYTSNEGGAAAGGNVCVVAAACPAVP